MSEQQPPPPRKPLAAAEAGARHLLLMIGFGVVSYVGGTIFMGSLVNRISQRADLSWGPVPLLLAVLSDGGWVLGALPAVAYLAARFMGLRPWSTAIIGAMSGLMFQLSLIYVSGGEEALFGNPLRAIIRLAAVVAGVVLTATAVKRGRAAAEAAELKARADAEAKKSQYDEFVKQSEALADRREQVPIAEAPAQAAPVPDASGPDAPPTPPPKPEPPG